MAQPKVDLRPPIGTRAGLPFTFVWADNQGVTNPTTAGYALGDTDLWTDPNTGTNVQPAVPLVAGVAAPASYPLGAEFDPAIVNYYGLTSVNTPPVLNWGDGCLEHAQALQGAGMGRWSNTSPRAFPQATVITKTESGRFNAQGDHTANASGQIKLPKPANHTWHQFRQDSVDVQSRPSILADNAFLPSYDIAQGVQVDLQGPHPTPIALTHKSDLCLPSNGLGATYGDRHNIRYAVSLTSSGVAWGGSLSNPALNDFESFSSHWSINAMSMERAPKWNVGILDGDPNAKILSQPDGWGKGTQAYRYPKETVQVIGVNDLPTGPSQFGGTQWYEWRPLGRVDLGNLCVADSVGLVGYEGFITATAFMKVSETSNTPDMSGALPPATAYTDTGKGTFAGINIQVHSGLSVRRNGMAFESGDASKLAYRYADASNSHTAPIQEALQTTGNWTQFNGTNYPQMSSNTANQSRFYTGRTLSTAATGLPPLPFEAFNTVEQEVKAGNPVPLIHRQSLANGYIIGDTSTGQSAPWTGTIQLSQDFMKDRIPTKVQVIPSLVGYEKVVVSGALHPSGQDIQYRKPIVDYHVLVSLAPRDRVVIGSNLTRTTTGVTTDRNAPVPNRNSVRLNLENEACEIMHAVFRIDPNLSRIIIDNTLAVNTPTETDCDHSALPTDWNLHQVTPFRPIANSSWSRIPLLSGAIEAGGLYQQGGISHHWSADSYGGELFVGVDAIDLTHFNDEIYGSGQYKPAGGVTAAIPDGCELMIFKYDPSTDPWYNKAVNRLGLQQNITQANATTAIQSSVMFTPKTDRLRTANKGWLFHDWVFPQIELMRYVGREDKSAMKHPRHSGNSGNDPMFHPTLHCGDLSIMEDGRMMMAAIHRDYIGSEEEYPSNSVGYPYNPDAGSGAGCPAGYYYSNGQCIPITGGDNPDDGDGTHYDPVTGQQTQGPRPQPSTGSGTGYAGGGDNFSPWPSWSRIVANTSARSLIILWSEIPAKDGKCVGSQTVFDYKSSKANGTDIHTQSWVIEDNWWSGSRLAYWYQESGQRAIPMTYGSYPECRMAFPTLPKSLPHLGANDSIIDGYPMIQPAVKLHSGTVLGWNPVLQQEYNIITDAANYPTDILTHQTKLRTTHFVPSTIGFSDYGLSANPWQELGRAGWSFPRGLYDPIGYGDNSIFFSDAPEAVNVPYGTAISQPTQQKIWDGFASSSAYGGYMNGPMASLSHHGPLHYGIMSKDHPFRPDRIWKQIHGGMGYDLPLHLIAPPRVSVRARAGGRNALDLELETPFHRQEQNRLTGALNVSSSSQKGGQFFLRTNLWNAKIPTLPSSAPANTVTDTLTSGDRIRGPIVAQFPPNDLVSFWSDHPNDHFHAGAIPIMTGSDYDWNIIETERYAPATLARIQEMSKHDYIAMAEQLQSSVDVHISTSIRPVWDSGGIVTARGSGLRDNAMSAFTPTHRSSMNGVAVQTTNVGMTGLGHGQRILRTEEGTLHTFSLDRSAVLGKGNYPVWTHYSKPLHNDLFWNRKAMKVNPNAATYGGMDEVQPHLVTLAGGTPTNWKTHGAAFASDSNGTIHAVIEVEDDTGVHRLYYTYATRYAELDSKSPYPVYSWNWATDTLGQPIPAVRIQAPSPVDGGWDLRQPSLVCDSKDRLHLACRVFGRGYSAGTAKHSSIIYGTKLKEESNWPALPTGAPADMVVPPNSAWSIVNRQTSEANSGDNDAESKSGHASQQNDCPKVCLLGDDTPVVFYRGLSDDQAGGPAFATAYGARALSSVYVNVGTSPSLTAPQGRFVFDPLKATMCLGNIGTEEMTQGYIYYDAAIDDDNRAYVVGIKSDNIKSTYLNTFDAGDTLSDQYTTTSGLGQTKALLRAGPTQRPEYSDITMTCNQGQIHMIVAFTQGDTTGLNIGAVILPDTKESTASPWQWAGSPSDPVTGDYDTPATVDEWPKGGSNPSLQGDRKHFMEIWMPSMEISQAAGSDDVIRSINVRWLSVPSMGYDATTGWYPVGSAQSLNGHEDFVHSAPQLRQQRFWGYSSGELDLRWTTNELAWMNTPHQGSKLYYPYIGGATLQVGEGSTSGEGIAGWP